MSLERTYKYKVGDRVRYTQGEEARIINLLKDVRASVSMLKPAFSNQRLDIILENVEKGEWIIQERTNTKYMGVELDYNVDLSQAKQMINNYRHDSEGGCQSCKLREVYHPFQGESFTYCSRVEDEVFAKNFWNINNSKSPTIKEFSDTGCKDKKPIISRKLEEVLEDYKSE